MSRILVVVCITLLVGSALPGCTAAQANGPVNVEVRLDDFSVESSLTDFKPGVPYHFTLINEAKIPHEFMIIPVPVAGVHRHGSEVLPIEEQHEMALVLVPESRLPAGATVELDYTFENVPRESL